VSQPADETRPSEPANPVGINPAGANPAGANPGAVYPGSALPPPPPVWSPAPAAQAQPVTPPRPPTAPATRDGLFVNLVWEGILLVVTVVLVGATLASTPGTHLDLIISPVGY